MLSASENNIPDFLGLTERTSSPLTSSKDFLRRSDIECEWCRWLIETPEVPGVKELLLDMFGRWQGERLCFAVITSESERLRKIKGPEAWEAFFVPRNASVAGYMCLGSEGWTTYKSHNEAYEFARTSTAAFLIVALKAEPKKVRPIPWRKTITSSQVSLPRISCGGSTLFQHDLAKFKYAGQLKKSSFSPYMPYSSILSERATKCPSERCSFYGLLSCVHQFMKKPRAQLHSLTMHVLEDGDGECYLVNITDVIWAERELLTMMPVLGMEPKSPVMRAPMKSKTDTKKCAMDLLGKSLARVPYVDSTEIREKNIALYPLSLPSIHSPRSPSLQIHPSIPQSLSEVADKLDEQRRRLELTKHALMISAMLGRPGLKEAVKTAWLELAKVDSLRRFFQGVPEDRLMQAAEQFYGLLTQPRGGLIAKRLRQSHQNMRITSDMYDTFACILAKTLMAEGVTEEEKEALMERFMAYKQDLTNEA